VSVKLQPHEGRLPRSDLAKAVATTVPSGKTFHESGGVLPIQGQPLITRIRLVELTSIHYSVLLQKYSTLKYYAAVRLARMAVFLYRIHL
jgi:hypothetical protein